MPVARTPNPSASATDNLPTTQNRSPQVSEGLRPSAQPTVLPHPPRRPRGLGAWGEDYACDFVTQLGMRVIERNWTCARGEIDIVAIDGEFLVAVEVKTRRDGSRGTALEAVTPRKLQALRRLILLWLEQQSQAPQSRCIRIDVVAITRPATGQTHVDYVRGAQ